MIKLSDEKQWQTHKLFIKPGRYTPATIHNNIMDYE